MGKWERRIIGGVLMFIGTVLLIPAIGILFVSHPASFKFGDLIEISATLAVLGIAFLLGGYATFVRLRITH